MRILVTGATGNVGEAVVNALHARGVPAVAGVRPGTSSTLPIPVVNFDFEAPGTWQAALTDVDRVFLLRPPSISNVRDTLNAFVDYGADQLKHVVFLSVAGVEKNRFIPHASVEKHLRASGIPWTFIRSGFFAQNLTGPYRQDIRDDDRLYVPAGSESVSWVDARDVGEAAALAFASPDAQRAAWTLTGRETRTFDEVARLLSTQLDRPIRYEAASIVGYLWHLRRRRHLPWSACAVYTVLHTAIRLGAENRIVDTLEQVLGRPPRTIEDTIRDNLQLWSRPSHDREPSATSKP